MFRKGDEPIGGYRLVKSLGHGQFGEVWKATAPGGASVALKFVDVEGEKGLKEYRAVKRIRDVRDAHLLPINALWLLDQHNEALTEDAWDRLDEISTGLIAQRDDALSRPSTLVVAMPLGDMSLANRLATCLANGMQGIPAEELLGYIEDAAKGIDFLNGPLHDLGDGLVALQHCDIKPQNILIVGRTAVICDFGLARVLAGSQATKSNAGRSPAYASPEVVETGQPSSKTDQYALAITYYELRTGCLPFGPEVKDQVTVYAAILAGRLDFSGVPDAERKVLKRATAIDPDNRFPDALSMVRSLQATINANAQKKNTSPTYLGEYQLQRRIHKIDDVGVYQALDAQKQLVTVYVCPLSKTTCLARPDALRQAKYVSRDPAAFAGLCDYFALDGNSKPWNRDEVNTRGLPEKGWLVLVARFVPGQLMDVIRNSTAHPAVLLPRFREIAHALDALATTSGTREYPDSRLAHLGVCPVNILCDGDRAVLANFSTVTLYRGDSQRLGPQVAFKATPFTPPELTRNTVTRWSDQYMLAVTYVKMRTGPVAMRISASSQAPCDAPSEDTTLIDLSGLLDWEQSVLRVALSPEPARRYRSCAAFVAALEQAERTSVLPEAAVRARMRVVVYSPLEITEDEHFSILVLIELCDAEDDDPSPKVVAAAKTLLGDGFVDRKSSSAVASLPAGFVAEAAFIQSADACELVNRKLPLSNRAGVSYAEFDAVCKAATDSAGISQCKIWIVSGSGSWGPAVELNLPVAQKKSDAPADAAGTSENNGDHSLSKSCSHPSGDSSAMLDDRGSRSSVAPSPPADEPQDNDLTSTRPPTDTNPDPPVERIAAPRIQEQKRERPRFRAARWVGCAAAIALCIGLLWQNLGDQPPPEPPEPPPPPVVPPPTDLLVVAQNQIEELISKLNKHELDPEPSESGSWNADASEIRKLLSPTSSQDAASSVAGEKAELIAALDLIDARLAARSVFRDDRDWGTPLDIPAAAVNHELFDADVRDALSLCSRSGNAADPRALGAAIRTWQGANVGTPRGDRLRAAWEQRKVQIVVEGRQAFEEWESIDAGPDAVNSTGQPSGLWRRLSGAKACDSETKKLTSRALDLAEASFDSESIPNAPLEQLLKTHSQLRDYFALKTALAILTAPCYDARVYRPESSESKSPSGSEDVRVRAGRLIETVKNARLSKTVFVRKSTSDSVSVTFGSPANFALAMIGWLQSNPPRPGDDPHAGLFDEALEAFANSVESELRNRPVNEDHDGELVDMAKRILDAPRRDRLETARDKGWRYESEKLLNELRKLRDDANTPINELQTRARTALKNKFLKDAPLPAACVVEGDLFVDRKPTFKSISSEGQPAEDAAYIRYVNSLATLAATVKILEIEPASYGDIRVAAALRKWAIATQEAIGERPWRRQRERAELLARLFVRASYAQVSPSDLGLPFASEMVGWLRAVPEEDFTAERRVRDELLALALDALVQNKAAAANDPAEIHKIVASWNTERDKIQFNFPAHAWLTYARSYAKKREYDEAIRGYDEFVQFAQQRSDKSVGTRFSDVATCKYGIRPAIALDNQTELVPEKALPEAKERMANLYAVAALLVQVDREAEKELVQLEAYRSKRREQVVKELLDRAVTWNDTSGLRLRRGLARAMLSRDGESFDKDTRDDLGRPVDAVLDRALNEALSAELEKRGIKGIASYEDRERQCEEITTTFRRALALIEDVSRRGGSETREAGVYRELVALRLIGTIIEHANYTTDTAKRRSLLWSGLHEIDSLCGLPPRKIISSEGKPVAIGTVERDLVFPGRVAVAEAEVVEDFAYLLDEYEHYPIALRIFKYIEEKAANDQNDERVRARVAQARCWWRMAQAIDAEAKAEDKARIEKCIMLARRILLEYVDDDPGPLRKEDGSTGDKDATGDGGSKPDLAIGRVDIAPYDRARAIHQCLEMEIYRKQHNIGVEPVANRWLNCQKYIKTLDDLTNREDGVIADAAEFKQIRWECRTEMRGAGRALLVAAMDGALEVLRDESAGEQMWSRAAKGYVDAAKFDAVESGTLETKAGTKDFYQRIDEGIAKIPKDKGGLKDAAVLLALAAFAASKDDIAKKWEDRQYSDIKRSRPKFDEVIPEIKWRLAPFELARTINRESEIPDWVALKIADLGPEGTPLGDSFESIARNVASIGRQPQEKRRECVRLVIAMTRRVSPERLKRTDYLTYCLPLRQSVAPALEQNLRLEQPPTEEGEEAMQLLEALQRSLDDASMKDYRDRHEEAIAAIREIITTPPQ